MWRLQIAHTGVEARMHITGQPNDGSGYGPYSHHTFYDVWGNLTYRLGWGGANPSYTATYTNNRRDGLSYDAAGNVTWDGGQSFSYDATGQQTAASNSGYSLAQAYDGDRLRVKKTENGYDTYYLRSSVLGGQVVCEINSGGVWQRGYVYLGSQLLAVQAGGVFWTHQDPVTKSQRLTDSNGNITSAVDLDPWGGETSRGWQQWQQPRKFTTYERDGNGNDQAMARSYHGFWQRFDQPDPSDGSMDLTEPQSLNRYAYVQNDPVNFVDPTGLYGIPGEDGDPVRANGGDGFFLSITITAWGVSGAHERPWVDSWTRSFWDPGQGRGHDAAGGGPPQTTQQQQSCNPSFFNDNQSYTIAGDSQNRSFTGADLNFAARVVFAESSSITSGLGDQTNRERDAITSVLYNRIGATGFPDRTARTTFQGVAEAPNAFESVTRPGYTRKFDSSAPGQFQNLQEANANSAGNIVGGDCNDLRGSVDAIRRLVNYGSQHSFTQFRGGIRGPGTVIGGSRFF